ncbi:ankyrin repeat protein, partial [Ostertagia ostertagi]
MLNISVGNRRISSNARVLSSPWFRDAQRLSVYVHTGGEIETDRIVEESLKQGKQLFIPKRANTPLHVAARLGLLTAVQTLCHCGADVDVANQ